MIIHYNNGEIEKLINDILCITIVDRDSPAIVTLRNEKEIQIKLDGIESILNDDVAMNASFVRRETAKEFAATIIKEIIPSVMNSHSEQALRLSLAICSCLEKNFSDSNE